ncbi:hypothetical protein ACFQYP_07560 [Nonomuraea antimicrobica]
MNRILNEEPELGKMEGLLGDLVAACLSKDPAQRPSADELIVRLTGQPAPNAAVEPVTGRSMTIPAAGAAAAAAAAAQMGSGGAGSSAPGRDDYPGPWTQPTGPVAVGGPLQSGPQSAAPPQTGDYGHALAGAVGGPGGAPHGGPQAGMPQGGPGQGGPGPSGHGQSGQGGQGQGAPGMGAPGLSGPGLGGPAQGVPGQAGPGQSGPGQGGGTQGGGPFGAPASHPAGNGPMGAPGTPQGRPFQAGGPGTRPGGTAGPGGTPPSKQRRTLTLALSGAAAAALLVVVGAVVVQANSQKVPVVAVDNATDNTNGNSNGSGGGQPPASVEQSPPVTPPAETSAPVPTLDIEPEETTKSESAKEPIAQVPDPVTQAPAPETTTSSPDPKPTKKKQSNLVDPDPEPTAAPTSGPTTTLPPTKKPTARPTAAPQKPNMTKATTVCGAGYKVIDSRALGSSATVYLLYSSSAAKNCVVTISRMLWPGKMSMNATLQVKGGSSGSNAGKFTSYAGPIRLPAAKKCVIWGGSWGATLSWKSGWSHCG